MHLLLCEHPVVPPPAGPVVGGARLGRGAGRGVRAEDGEEDGQQHEAVVEAEHDGQAEHLEEGDEDVGGGEPQQHQRQERRQPAVKHRRPDRGQSRDRALAAVSCSKYFFYVLSNILRDICFVTFRNNECVADVHGVVHAEPHGEHDVDAADDVDSDAPEVEEAHDVDECEQDGEEDEGGDAEVGEQHHDHGEDGGQRQPDVAPQLVPDNLVRLPGRVHLRTMLFTQLQTKV